MAIGAVTGVIAGAQAIAGIGQANAQAAQQQAQIQTQISDAKTQAAAKQIELKQAQAFADYQSQLGTMQRSAQLTASVMAAKAQDFMGQIQQQQADFNAKSAQSINNFNTLLGQSQQNFSNQTKLNNEELQAKSAINSNRLNTLSAESQITAADAQAQQQGIAANVQATGQNTATANAVASNTNGAVSAMSQADLNAQATQAMIAGSGVNSAMDASSQAQMNSAMNSNGGGLANTMAQGAYSLGASNQARQQQVGINNAGIDIAHQNALNQWNNVGTQGHLQDVATMNALGLDQTSNGQSQALNALMAQRDQQYNNSMTQSDLNSIARQNQLNQAASSAQIQAIQAASASDQNAADVNRIMAGTNFALQEGATTQSLNSQLAGLKEQSSTIGSGQAGQILGLLGQGYNIYNQVANTQQGINYQNQNTALTAGYNQQNVNFTNQYSQQQQQNPSLLYGGALGSGFNNTPSYGYQVYNAGTSLLGGHY